MKGTDPQDEALLPATNSAQLSYDRETPTRFDKTSVVLRSRGHNFSAEYELGFRDRNDGKPASANPYKNKLARDRWHRGWSARDRYTDAGYRWVEPITDSKALVWVILIAVLFGSFILGILQ